MKVEAFIVIKDVLMVMDTNWEKYCKCSETSMKNSENTKRNSESIVKSSIKLLDLEILAKSIWQ